GSSVRGRRRIGHAGNRRLRTALYLATLSAARHNPVIRPFYQRLLAAGKPKKVARCAAARKLLQLAWAVVKHKRPFDLVPLFYLPVLLFSRLPAVLRRGDGVRPRQCGSRLPHELGLIILSRRNDTYPDTLEQSSWVFHVTIQIGHGCGV